MALHTAFRDEQGRFAEANHNESLPTLPRRDPRLWTTFPHAFSSMARVTSRVNYIIHRGSPLVARRRLDLRYITYADLVRKLRRLAGCEFVRTGKHEIWQNKDGVRFPIPRHPGDLRKGTLAKIIKQAGLGISVEQFIRA
jgi:predicted RNA binding protein YcfA (HicA-like mRNA interferase family)